MRSKTASEYLHASVRWGTFPTEPLCLTGGGTRAYTRDVPVRGRRFLRRHSNEHQKAGSWNDSD
jgi:hypothetical protein